MAPWLMAGLEGRAEAAADDGLGLEGVLEDQAEGLRDMLDAHHQHGDGAHQEDGGHGGHQLLGDGAASVDAAQEDEGADHHQDDAHDPAGDG